MSCFFSLFQGVTGALTVLMKDAIKPNLMQTLEVSDLPFTEIVDNLRCGIACVPPYNVSVSS